MKKIIIVILVILVMGIGGIYMLNYNLDNGINNLTSEEEIILNRYKEMQQAMVDKDIDKLNSIVKVGTTFTHMSGRTQTREEYFEDIRNGALDYQSYTIKSRLSKSNVNTNGLALQGKTARTDNGKEETINWLKELGY